MYRLNAVGFAASTRRGVQRRRRLLYLFGVTPTRFLRRRREIFTLFFTVLYRVLRSALRMRRLRMGLRRVKHEMGRTFISATNLWCILSALRSEDLVAFGDCRLVQRNRCRIYTRYGWAAVEWGSLAVR